MTGPHFTNTISGASIYKSFMGGFGTWCQLKVRILRKRLLINLSSYHKSSGKRSKAFCQPIKIEELNFRREERASTSEYTQTS